MEVGVRELKQNLAAFLARASNGELIVVTERGKPKAVIGPLPGGNKFSLGIAQGWITAPGIDGPLPAAPGRHTASTSIQEMMDEDRGSA